MNERMNGFKIRGVISKCISLDWEWQWDKYYRNTAANRVYILFNSNGFFPSFKPFRKWIYYHLSHFMSCINYHYIYWSFSLQDPIILWEQAGNQWIPKNLYLNELPENNSMVFIDCKIVLNIHSIGKYNCEVGITTEYPISLQSAT